MEMEIEKEQFSSKEKDDEFAEKVIPVTFN